jgi:hypothetical protein
MFASVRQLRAVVYGSLPITGLLSLCAATTVWPIETPRAKHELVPAY